MSFDGKNPFKILRQTWNPGGWEKETLAGNRTHKHDDAQMLGLDCGGSGRDVFLAAPRKGAWVWIFNQSDAAENLSVIHHTFVRTTGAQIHGGDGLGC